MSSAPVPVDPAMLTALRERADGAGWMSYRCFSEVALFHPELGYYRRDRNRVGRGADTDFNTASGVGDVVFGALIVDAARALLGTDMDLREYTLVEIGAEPGRSIFRDVLGDFADSKVIRAGDPIVIPSRAVVFANELFDAQPFVRLRFESGDWREIGVSISEAGILSESLSSVLSPVAARAKAALPAQWAEGHVVDLSPDALDLMDRIVAGDWKGCVIFPDYGKTLTEFLDAVPQGTARAYRRHRQSNDLLDAPGEQDLTHHVDWAGLSDRLISAGFTGVSVDRQEAFLMKRASRELERRFTRAAAERDTGAMGVLRELVHPAHFGGKFQVLSGVRLG